MTKATDDLHEMMLEVYGAPPVGGAHWLKSQITEAHATLGAMGVPDRKRVLDFSSDMRGVEKDVSLGVPERIEWLREHWQPKR
jgi:hypothetical protein